MSKKFEEIRKKKQKCPEKFQKTQRKKHKFIKKPRKYEKNQIKCHMEATNKATIITAKIEKLRNLRES